MKTPNFCGEGGCFTAKQKTPTKVNFLFRKSIINVALNCPKKRNKIFNNIFHKRTNYLAGSTSLFSHLRGKNFILATDTTVKNLFSKSMLLIFKLQILQVGQNNFILFIWGHFISAGALGVTS